MAVVNTKSVSVTNADANPRDMTPVALAGGRVRAISETVEVAAADDDGSVYRLARVNSNWHIVSLLTLNDAITLGSQYDLGLYQIAENGGSPLSKACYAEAVSMATARSIPVDLAFEARNIDAIRNLVYQDGGLTTDSQRAYDLCFTANTVGTGAGTISANILYTVD